MRTDTGGLVMQPPGYRTSFPVNRLVLAVALRTTSSQLSLIRAWRCRRVEADLRALDRREVPRRAGGWNSSAGTPTYFRSCRVNVAMVMMDRFYAGLPRQCNNQVLDDWITARQCFRETAWERGRPRPPLFMRAGTPALPKRRPRPRNKVFQRNPVLPGLNNPSKTC